MRLWGLYVGNYVPYEKYGAVSLIIYAFPVS